MNDTAVADKPAVQTQPKAKADEKVFRPPLSPTHVQQADSKQMFLFATVPNGITVDELLVPGFWAHIAHTMTPWTEITCMPEDESFYCKLLVRDCGRLWALVSVLNHTKLARDFDEPSNPDYDIKRLGPIRKFGVRRIADNEIVRDGFVDKNAAGEWLAEHVKAMAR